MTYGVGDWFRIDDGPQHYVGRISALSRDRELAIAYIFGPFKAGAPITTESTAALTPDQAVLIARMETLPLDDGAWPVLGVRGNEQAHWDVSTAFCRSDVHRCYKVTFDEDDLYKVKERTRISSDLCAKLPEADIATMSSILSDLQESGSR